ncbi:MAG: Ig-like domain-containing protein [bacterium]
MKLSNFMNAGRTGGLMMALAFFIFAIALGALTTACGTSQIKVGDETAQVVGVSLSIPDNAADVPADTVISIEFQPPLTNSDDCAAIETALKINRSSDDAPITIGGMRWSEDYKTLELLDVPMTYKTQYSILISDNVVFNDGSYIEAFQKQFTTESNPLSIDQSDGRYASVVFENSGNADVVFGNQVCPAPKEPYWTLDDIVLQWSYDPGIGIIGQSPLNIGDGKFLFALNDGSILFWKGLTASYDKKFLPGEHLLLGAYAADINVDGVKDLVLHETPFWSPDGGTLFAYIDIFLMDRLLSNPAVEFNAQTQPDYRFDIKLDPVAAAHPALAKLVPLMDSGDINGDDMEDIVITYHDNDTGYNGINVGTANGAFPPPSTLIMMQPLWNVSNLKVRDINGDGNGDVIVGLADLSGGIGSPGQILVFMGRAGAFPTSSSLADMIIYCDTVGDGCADPLTIDLGDFNGDGIHDLVFSAAGDGTGIVYIIYGRENIDVDLRRVTVGESWDVAYFAESGKTQFGTEVVASIIGDLDNDGFDDFVVRSLSADGSMIYMDFILGGASSTANHVTYESSVACSTLGSIL